MTLTELEMGSITQNEKGLKNKRSPDTIASDHAQPKLVGEEQTEKDASRQNEEFNTLLTPVLSNENKCIKEIEVN